MYQEHIKHEQVNRDETYVLLYLIVIEVRVILVPLQGALLSIR